MFIPESSSPVKYVFIMQAETVNADTKFITRDSTTDRRVHREMICLVKTEARQRDTPGEKVCGHLLSEEECSKDVVKSFIQVNSYWSLSFVKPVIWFIFPHLTYPGTL